MKRFKITLKNGYKYAGRLITETDSYIEIHDIKLEKNVRIYTHEISVVEVEND